MLNLYVNSIYRMLVEQNIFKQLVLDAFKGVMLWVNLPRNLQFTAAQQRHMQHRLDVVESYINYKGETHRIDKWR